MKQLNYEVTINAPKQVVWHKMLSKETYNDWCSAFSKDSQYSGEWREGEKVKFFDPRMGGTLALLEVVRPYSRILAKHIAVLSKDHQEDTTSDAAKSWIGSTEAYEFDEKDGVTTLRVEIETHQDFVEMFDSAWPVALNNLRALAEQ